MKNRKGQSLIDILVGTAIGVILIFAAVAAIAPALRTGSQAARTQSAAFIAQGLLSNIQTWSDGDWHSVLALSTGTAYQYYLIASSSPYVATSGIESVSIGTSTYWRYFYLNDVERDASGNIVQSGGTYDPSTKQVTVNYGWLGSATNTASEYITRNQQQVYSQTDWTDGPSSTAGAVSTTNFEFSSSSNIDYSSPGSIKVGTL